MRKKLNMFYKFITGFTFMSRIDRSVAGCQAKAGPAIMSYKTGQMTFGF